jgi:PAS domain S-box-containing protein
MLKPAHNICEAVINESDDAILFRKIDGTITFWNGGAEKLYGWTKQESVGKVTHQFLKTQFPLTYLAQQDDLLQKGRWDGVLTHSTKSGDTVDVESRQIYLEPEDIVLEVNRDILPSRKVNECELMRVIMNSISQGIYVVDLDGKILFYNQATVRMYGEAALLGSIESITATGGIFLPDTVTPWSMKQMPVMRILAGGPPTGDLEYVKNAQKPEGVWVMVHAYMLRKSDGATAGAIAVIKEVVEASGKGLPSFDVNVPNFPL